MNARAVSSILRLAGVATVCFVATFARAQSDAAVDGEAGVPDADSSVDATLEAGPLDERPLDAGVEAASAETDAGADQTEARISEGAGPDDAGIDEDAGLDDAGFPEDDAGVPVDETIGATPPEPPPPPPPQVFPEDPNPAPEVAKEERPALLLRTILALLAVLALAYVGGHRRFRRMEAALGLRSLIAAGFPFVALGLIAKHPAIGALPDHALAAIDPLIEFSLAWLGLLVGLRFDLRAADSLPKPVGALVGLHMAVPFALATLACGAAMAWLGDGAVLTTALRFGVLLGIAAAMSTAYRSERRAGDSIHVLAGPLDEVVGVLGLALVAAYFRPQRVELAWDLPGTVWLFVAVGMGASLGLLAYILLRGKMSDAETMAIVLGVVAFAGGMAAYVALPPIVVCFVAGLMLANVPGWRKEELKSIMGLLERPIYLVFLFVAGALWDPGDWRGWVLLLVFVASRLGGLLLAARIARTAQRGFPGEPSAAGTALAPLSIVSIAVVAGVQSLYESRALPWMMTAVIGGAMLIELLAQALRRAPRLGSEE